MTVAVCTLGCTRKKDDIHSWNRLAELDGDYRLYVNWELQHVGENRYDFGTDLGFLDNLEHEISQFHNVDIDYWNWRSVEGRNGWRRLPAFDQDQARLSSIVTARNMCVEYAMQTNASHLLFVDADIIPPKDVIPKLLEVGEDAVGGLVYGRGVHSACPYIFGEKRRFKCGNPPYELVEVEHGNIGFMMISRKLFENIRFRYGTSRYPDGREHMISDDPAFHLDAFIKFGKWPVIRMDVVGQHVGDLKKEETSQF